MQQHVILNGKPTLIRPYSVVIDKPVEVEDFTKK